MNYFICAIYLLGWFFDTGKAKLSCEILKSKSGREYELSDAALDGIKYKKSQSKFQLMVFSCTCTDSKETKLQDRDEETFDLDDDLYDEEIDHDWRDSAIFQVQGCQKLELNLGRGQGSLSHSLDGAVLLIENIGELNINFFESGRKGGGLNEKSFTSIYIRNASINAMPSVWLFEEKAEVRFSRISILEDAFNIELQNFENNLDPVLVIEDSEFPGVKEAGGGVTPSDEKFMVKVKNEHLVRDNTSDDGQGCEFDFRGTVVVKRNNIGLLGSRGINVQGADSVRIYENFVDLAIKDSIRLDRVKEFHFVKNQVGFALSQPIIFLLYVKKESIHTACEKDDLPEESIKPTVLAGNTFQNLINRPIETDVDRDYSDQFLDEKFKLENNSVSSKCSCKDPKPLLEDSPSNDEIIFKKLIDGSKCLSTQNGEALIGNRMDICSGKHPQTAQEKETAAKEEVESQWRTYLIIAIILTAIFAALGTFLLIKFCFQSNTDVTPVGRP